MKPAAPVTALETVKWIPASSAQTYNSSFVKAIHLHAFAPGIQNPLAAPTQFLPGLTNHWTLALELVDSSGAIHIDPSPQYPNMSMLLLLSFRRDVVPPDVHKTVGIPVSRDLSVASFLHALQESGYDQYKFTDEGTGCRYWTACVVLMLLRQGSASSERVNAAENALHSVWEKDRRVDEGQQTAWDSKKGTFTKLALEQTG